MNVLFNSNHHSLLLHQALFEVFGEVRAYTACGIVGGDLAHVVFDHELHEFFERRLLRVPAEFGPRLGRVAPEVHDVRGPVEVRAHLHQHATGGLVDTLLIGSLPDELELDADMAEGQGAEIAHAVLDAGGDDEVFRLLLLEDEPHALDIILRIAPVAEAGEVAEIQLVLLALGDAGGGQRDLASDERLATPLGFVVEQDAGAAVHAVRLAVLLDNPETVQLRDRIRAVGMEGRILVLGHFLHLSVQFRGGRLIDPARPGEAALAHGLQDTEDAGSIDIRRIFRRVEAHLHVALRREVVDFVRPDLADHLDEAHGVAHVGIMQVEMRLAFQVRDAFAEVHRAAADDAVHVVSFLQQELREVGAVLARHPRDKRRLHRMLSFFCQVDAERRLNLPETLPADAHLSGQPPAHRGLVLADPFGQFPLRNTFLGKRSLDFVDNLVIYHRCKVTAFIRLDKIFKQELLT